MSGWTELLEEIKHCKTSKDENAFDVIRKKYLLALHHYTKRNIIAYYSGFLQQGNVFGIDINDLDINGFMTTIHKLDCSKGLDLI
ncbi:MAG: hypothetical protein IJU79_00960 [Desulfovibrionaceae bacterium]|nr:hypothetical protein [Desulfovibrionaceae bacterium]